MEPISYDRLCLKKSMLCINIHFFIHVQVMIGVQRYNTETALCFFELKIAGSTDGPVGAELMGYVIFSTNDNILSIARMVNIRCFISIY